MSVINGAPIFLREAAAADDAYQIEKSLRFSEEDSAKLSRTPSSEGNRRTWTYNVWVKANDKHSWLLSAREASAHYTHLGFNESGKVHFHNRQSSGSNITDNFTSDALFRDFSAWAMVTYVFDSTNSVESERMRVYYNGKRLTGNNNYPVQNQLSFINIKKEHTIGYEYTNNQYRDVQIADAQLIDGLALSPAAFGSFDDAGNWNPKEFALPAPNQGTTYSSSATSTGSVWDKATNNNNLFTEEAVYDGDLNTAAGPYESGGTLATLTLPVGNQTGKHFYRIHGRLYADGKWEDQDGNLLYTSTADNDSYVWYDLGWHSDITSLKVTAGTSGNASTVHAIEVDGVILRDGFTDPTTRSKINNGKQWSAGVTLPGSGVSGTAANLFDGSLSTWVQTSNSSDWVIMDLGSVAFSNSFELYGSSSYDQDYKFYHGGGTLTWSGHFGGNAWRDFASSLTSPVTKVEYKDSGGSGTPSIAAIRVDGEVLVDLEVDNSFHLKFNDTSSNTAIGYDSFMGKIADSEGALPIYNTTDDYGATKGSGLRSDSSAGTTDGAGLLLAIPGDTIADTHATLNTGSSNKSITNVGTLTTSTSQSKFYGTSLFFDNSGEVDGGKYLSLGDDSDFEPGSSNFTFEAWVYLESYSTTNGKDRVIAGKWDSTSNGREWLLAIRGSGGSDPKELVFAHKGDMGHSDIKSGSAFPLQQWVHVAAVRNGSNFNVYQDGLSVISATGWSGSFDTTDRNFYIGYSSYDGYLLSFHGYMQDVRWYKAAKYTSAFRAPVRNDWTVTNLTEAATDTTITAASGNITYKQWDSAWNESSNIWDTTPDSSGTTNSVTWDGQNSTLIMDLGAANARITIDEITGSGGAVLTGDDPTKAKAFWTNQDLNIEGFDNANMPNYVCPHRYMMIYAGVGGGSSSFTASGDAGSSFVINNTKNIDVLNDTPTNYESDGTAHGNYCTLNPLALGSNLTLSQGNLNITGTSGTLAVCLGTMAVSSGKWYYEFTFNNSSKLSFIAGITNRTKTGDLADWIEPGDYSWNGNGNTWHDVYSNGSAISDFSGDGPTAASDVIGVLLDFDNTTITIKLNNSTKGNITTSLPAGLYTPLIGNGSGAAELDANINFGQRPFKYAQSGFKGWCTQNLDDFDTDNDPSKYFDILTWTGTGSNDNNQKGLAFQPDFAWIKCRSAASQDHVLVDAVRGASSTWNTNAGSSAYTASSPHHEVQAFLSDGVTTGQNGRVGTSGETYVGYFWDAGTSGGANTDGGVDVDSPNQWVNTTAGFSITKYRGPGSGTINVGHGLNAVPEFVFTKNLGISGTNAVYHKNLDASAPADKYQAFNGADPTGDWPFFGDTIPTNSLMYFGSGDDVNDSDQDIMMYAFTSIPGYSKFGTYTGNGNADGPMINLGFRPKWFMVKEIGSSTDWYILDSVRSPDNEVVKSLKPNSDNVEVTDNNFVDFLSNGVKFRTDGGAVNGNGDGYIFAAFAEHPFKTARAR